MNKILIIFFVLSYSECIGQSSELFQKWKLVEFYSIGLDSTKIKQFSAKEARELVLMIANNSEVKIELLEIYKDSTFQEYQKMKSGKYLGFKKGKILPNNVLYNADEGMKYKLISNGNRILIINKEDTIWVYIPLKCNIKNFNLKDDYIKNYIDLFYNKEK